MRKARPTGFQNVRSRRSQLSVLLQHLGDAIFEEAALDGLCINKPLMYRGEVLAVEQFSAIAVF